MGRESGWSRRRFVKGLGTTVGAVGLSGSVDATSAGQAPPIVQGLPEPSPNSAYPTLNRRTLGWLRLLWEKATTKDDWSSNGVPHPWWDRYTAPVVLARCSR